MTDDVAPTRSPPGGLPSLPPPAGPPPRAVPPAVDPALEGRALVRLAAGFYGVVVVFAIGYAAFSNGLQTLLGDRLPAPGPLLAAIVLALAIVGLGLAGVRLVPALRRAGEAFTAILGPYGYGQALLLALLSGVGEELLFRGALWPHLHLVGTTFLFGLVHVLPKRALLAYPLFAAAVGLLLGLLREASGSTLPPMLAHVLINAMNLVVLERRRRAGSRPSSP